MKTNLVIFDLDGVLCQTETLIKQAIVKAAAAQKVTVTQDWLFEHAHGMSALDTVATLSAYGDVAMDYHTYLADLDHTLDALMEKRLTATPGIAAQLPILLQAGKKICIATGSRRVKSIRKLQLCAIDSYFPDELIFTAEQVAKGKPAPDVFLLAANTLGVAPDDCVVIEDSSPGVRAGKAAGMFTIGYTGGDHYGISEKMSAKVLQRAGADLVIDSYNELLRVLP